MGEGTEEKGYIGAEMARTVQTMTMMATPGTASTLRHALNEIEYQNADSGTTKNMTSGQPRCGATDIQCRATCADHTMLIAFGVQGLHCLTQMSDESLVSTRFIKGPREREER